MCLLTALICTLKSVLLDDIAISFLSMNKRPSFTCCCHTSIDWSIVGGLLTGQ